jgi:hypothetical protein
LTHDGLVQIAHALAAAEPLWALSPEDWPPLARALVAAGGTWPAAKDLGELGPDDLEAISDAVTRLAAQAASDLDGRPPLPYWDAVVGLTARAWRLGVLDSPDEVVTHLSGHWWDIREVPALRGRGVTLIGEALGVYESAALYDTDEQSRKLAAEADALLAPEAVPAPFCEAFLWATRP